jgi:hypothetical protein
MNYMAKHLGTQKSIRFSDDELKLLEAGRKQYGSYKAAVIAGLNCLDGRGEITNDEIITILQERLKKS